MLFLQNVTNIHLPVSRINQLIKTVNNVTPMTLAFLTQLSTNFFHQTFNISRGNAFFYQNEYLQKIVLIFYTCLSIRYSSKLLDQNNEWKNKNNTSNALTYSFRNFLFVNYNAVFNKLINNLCIVFELWIQILES